MSVDFRIRIQHAVEELALHDGIDPSENLFEAGHLTSVHVLDLIVFLESDLEMTVGDEDLTEDNFATIDRMVAFAERALQPQPAG